MNAKSHGSIPKPVRLSLTRDLIRSHVKSFRALCAVLSLMLVVLSAQAVALRMGAVRGFPGNTVDVPVSLTYRSNEVRDVVALQADVLFDASGVTDGSPVSGPSLSRHVLASSTPSRGVRRLLVYSAENAVLTNGTVAKIPFTVGPNEFRNFSLTLSNVILVRGDASQVTATNANGFVGVNQVFVAPDGHVDGFLNVASNSVEQCYVIQTTTDFVTWVTVQTNRTEASLLAFIDPAGGGQPHRFYRAVVCDAANGLRIGTITQLPSGQVQLDFDGVVGRSYVIQASTNLLNWQDLGTVTAAIGRLIYTTADGPRSPYRFFRLKSAP